MYDIALIIVNYKMTAYIAACLTSIKQQIKDSNLSIATVIVDNNSQDNLAEIVARAEMDNCSVVYLRKNKGYGGGVNAGIQAVKATYYFVINPDLVFFEPNTCTRLYNFMEENQGIGMAVPKLLNTDGSLQYSCWRFPSTWVPLYRRTSFGNTRFGKKALEDFQMRDWNHAQTRPVDCAMGSAMFVRASMLDEVGLMDEQYFMYFEDMDWCRSFWKHAKPVYYVHDVRIRHHWQRGSAKVQGLKALIMSSLTRVHVRSWLRYMYKWRNHAQ